MNHWTLVHIFVYIFYLHRNASTSINQVAYKCVVRMFSQRNTCSQAYETRLLGAES